MPLINTKSLGPRPSKGCQLPAAGGIGELECSDQSSEDLESFRTTWNYTFMGFVKQPDDELLLCLLDTQL